MKVRSPRGVALLAALVISTSACVLISILAAWRDVEIDGRELGWFTMGLFAVSFFITHTLIQRFIFHKIRVIYKNIHRYKGTKERAGDFNMGDDVMEDVKLEVEEWASERANEIAELKAAHSFRREFIGNLAHELKTPIFNIQGYVLTLIEGGLNDPEIAQKFLAKAAKNVDRMAGMIEDLDIISKMESGQLDVYSEPFNLGELVSDVVEALEVRAFKAGIALEITDGSIRSQMVEGDRSKIEQVLTNLVSNSLAYGVEGGKTQLRFYDMDTQVLVEVADDGIGIKESDLPRIFERFYRVDKSRSRNAGGSGLGLAIVKHIVESHGQNITVRSTYEQGSTFSFTLAKA
jgi:two-component system, OmpR family, phosphate regulon sensor histidine kinase PhoR